MTWLLVFLVFPVIGNLIFFLWGRNPYRPCSKEHYYLEQEKYLTRYQYKLNHQVEESDFQTMAQFNYLTAFEPVFNGTKVETLFDVRAFFDAVMAAVEEAEKTICLQYYIISDGFFMNLLFQKLQEKADQGIQVYLFYDWVGCIDKLDWRMMATMLAHPNIHISCFDSRSDLRRPTTNYRSHRKFLIVDDQVAIYGGSNIGDEYLSNHLNFNNWVDLNFRVQGEIVKRFLTSFLSDWEENGKDVLI